MLICTLCHDCFFMTMSVTKCALVNAIIGRGVLIVLFVIIDLYVYIILQFNVHERMLVCS